MTRRIAWPAGSVLVALLTLAVLCGPAAAQEELQNPMEKQSLGELLFNIRHQLRLGVPDAATGYINVLLGRNPPPGDVLNAIRDDRLKVLNDPESGVEVWLKRAAASDNAQLKVAAGKLLELIEAGVRGSRDPKDVEKLINSLAGTMRQRDEAIRLLADMAPWSLPQMLDVLFRDDRAALRPDVTTALPEMGRGAVEPLCAALEAPGAAPTKISIIRALVRIGYPHAIPYIQRLAEQTDSDQFKAVCRDAIAALGRSPRASFTGSAGQMFRQLGEAYYTDYYATSSSLLPPVTGNLMPIWSYDPAVGVISTPVPRAIFMDVMAARSLVTALSLDSNQPEATALWVAASLRKEAALAGQPDPTARPDQPPADYFAVLSGPSCLLRALNRALEDRDAAVALALVRAMGKVGLGGLAQSDSTVLEQALAYPDRRVRYEAALIYKAYSKIRMPGTDRAARILADAVGQTGEKRALALVGKLPDQQKALLEHLQTGGYKVDTFATIKALLDQARSPAVAYVNLLVIPFDVPEGGLAGLAELRKDARLRFTPVLMPAAVAETVEAAVKELPLVAAIADAAPAAEVADKIAKLREKGDRGLSEDDAKAYALLAAAALREMALSPAAGKDVLLVVPALTHALADGRAEVVAAAADALGAVDDAVAQRALAEAALAKDGKLDAASRVAVFRALAASAKRFGNKLTGEQMSGIAKAAVSDADLTVRAAAAEAAAPLDLPASQIEPLIVGLGKPAKAPTP